MRHKKILILPVIILGIVLIAAGGYSVYRRFAPLHSPSDEKLSEGQTENATAEIISAFCCIK